MRELLVLRHAQAEPAGAGEDDRSRALSVHGQAQARAVGRWLAAQGLRPDSVVCSSARRTRATAAGVIAAWESAPPVRYLQAMYAATPDTLLELLTHHAQGDRMLLVGHNPGVQQLVGLLCPDVPAHQTMPPAGLACIALDGAPKPGTGRLAAFHAG